MEATEKTSHKKIVIALSILLVAIIAVLIGVWAVYGEKNQKFECTNFAMGSYIQQTVYGKNSEEAAAQAASSIGNLENLISWRIEGSDIAKLNSAAGTVWTGLDQKTISILAVCLELAQRSGGAYDPTILPISSLWDFGGENQHLPDQNQIAQFLPYVDYNNLRVNKEESTASLKMHYNAVDLGGVGKGAACDEAVAAYEKAGISGGIIAVGGSVGVYGLKPDGKPWRISVRDPHSSSDSVSSLGVLEIDSGFVSTSGSYEKTFEENGVTYHHLLNPKTGYPENNGLLSVTIWHENGAISDALATACFVLGSEKGMELAKSYGAGALFINGQNEITVNEKMQECFTLDVSAYTICEVSQ